jgi:hypothetical protein
MVFASNPLQPLIDFFEFFLKNIFHDGWASVGAPRSLR